MLVHKQTYTKYIIIKFYRKDWLAVFPPNKEKASQFLACFFVKK